MYNLNRLKYLLVYYNQDVDGKKVLFQAYHGKCYAGSPKAIYEEMLSDERFVGYHFVWAFNNPEEKNDIKLNSCTKVEYNSKEYYKELSKAGYWIINSRIPLHVIKKRNQKYIQCWHGTPFKRIGADVIGNNNSMNTYKEILYRDAKDVVRYDYFLSQSSFATEKFNSAFRFKQLNNKVKVIEVGYPRNDTLFNFDLNQVNNVKSKIGIPLSKKVILYAPTWRDDQYESGSGYSYDFEINIDNWRKIVGDEYVILFRTHYLIGNVIDFEKNKDFIF